MVSSFWMLLDDVIAILDDVAVMTKVAVKKTAGVVGDDLALSASQLSGLKDNRELAVIWAVAKGSLINKIILVPLALLMATFMPWAVVPMLVLGGLYLCFEGAEKVIHYFHPVQQTVHEKALHDALLDPTVDLVALEKDKIRGAIRTDFILSAEIIVIALGSVANETLQVKMVVLSVIGVLMTMVVYGLVAAIVRLDDWGLALIAKKNELSVKAGQALLRSAPVLLRVLSVFGVLAMFAVGGSILAHSFAVLNTLFSSINGWVFLMLAEGALGLSGGMILVLLLTLFQRVRGK